MSRRPHNIVIGGMGVRVKRTDEEVERSMVVKHIFVGVPRTLAFRSVVPMYKRRKHLFKVNTLLQNEGFSMLPNEKDLTSKYVSK